MHELSAMGAVQILKCCQFDASSSVLLFKCYHSNAISEHSISHLVHEIRADASSTVLRVAGQQQASDANKDDLMT